jgi:hypothetical protein
MNKPTSMVINETRISLANVLNTSNLPPCILEMIVKELYDEVRQLSSFQSKQDEENYAKALKDAESENNKQETK